MESSFLFMDRRRGYQAGCVLLLVATVLGIFAVASPGWYSVEVPGGRQFYSHLWIVCSQGVSGCRMLNADDTKDFEKAAQAFSILGLMGAFASCLLATALNFLTDSVRHHRALEIAVLVSGGLLFLSPLIFASGNPDYVSDAWARAATRVSNAYGLALTFVAALTLLLAGALLFFFNRPLRLPGDQRSLSQLQRRDPVDLIHRGQEEEEERRRRGGGGGGGGGGGDRGVTNPGLNVSEVSLSPSSWTPPPAYRTGTSSSGVQPRNGAPPPSTRNYNNVNNNNNKGFRASSESMNNSSNNILMRGRSAAIATAEDSPFSRQESPPASGRQRRGGDEGGRGRGGGGSNPRGADARDFGHHGDGGVPQHSPSLALSRRRFGSRDSDLHMTPQSRDRRADDWHSAEEELEGDSLYEEISNGGGSGVGAGVDLGDPTPSYFTPLGLRRASGLEPGQQPPKAAPTGDRDDHDGHVYTDLAARQARLDPHTDLDLHNDRDPRRLADQPPSRSYVNLHDDSRTPYQGQGNDDRHLGQRNDDRHQGQGSDERHQGHRNDNTRQHQGQASDPRHQGHQGQRREPRPPGRSGPSLAARRRSRDAVEAEGRVGPSIQTEI